MNMVHQKRTTTTLPVLLYILHKLVRDGFVPPTGGGISWSLDDKWKLTCPLYIYRAPNYFLMETYSVYLHVPRKLLPK